MKKPDIDPRFAEAHYQHDLHTRPHERAAVKDRESTIEAHLVKRVKALGGEVRKVQWVGRRGAPDRLVMLPYATMDAVHNGQLMPGRPTTIWVELKAPGDKPRPEQLREHERMRAMGQRVVVIDSIEGVEELLR